MNKQKVTESIKRIFHECPGNLMTETMTDTAELVGLQLFDEPLLAFGSAGDALFGTYKKPGVVGPWHMSPEEWLPGAKTVISIFFPFTERVRRSNRGSTGEPSLEWLYGRVEGQNFIEAFTKAVRAWLLEEKIGVCAPSLDSRFQTVTGGKGITGYPEINEKTFGSRWSERHAAYACGMGTFGLSRGIITEKGMAGRLSSVIVDLALEPDARRYSGIYDYCIQCGACIHRCPVEAISFEGGKNHTICSAQLKVNKKRYAPRYGCGQCQTKVPCESQIPKKALDSLKNNEMSRQRLDR